MNEFLYPGKENLNILTEELYYLVRVFYEAEIQLPWGSFIHSTIQVWEHILAKSA